MWRRMTVCGEAGAYQGWFDSPGIAVKAEVANATGEAGCRGQDAAFRGSALGAAAAERVVRMAAMLLAESMVVSDGWVSPNRTSAADLFSGGGAPSRVVAVGGGCISPPIATVGMVETELATAPVPPAVFADRRHRSIGDVDEVGELKHIFVSNHSCSFGSPARA